MWPHAGMTGAIAAIHSSRGPELLSDETDHFAVLPSLGTGVPGDRC